MGLIRELVINLAILLILASLMEMLLPLGNLRNFVKMIMGLFLIVTIMNPILKLMDQPIAFEITNPMLSSSTQGILEKGQQIQKASEQLALQNYEENLAQQVKAVAKLTPNLAVEKVQVSVDAANQKGQIKEIMLTVTPAEEQQKKALVEPVEIEIPAKGGGDQEKAKAATAKVGKISEADKQTLAETIANFYNLPPEKIVIQAK